MFVFICTQWTIKMYHIVFDHNSSTSWAIVMLFMPMETRTNTLHHSTFTEWRDDVMTASHCASTKSYFLELLLKIKQCCILKIKFWSDTCGNVNDLFCQNIDKKFLNKNWKRRTVDVANNRFRRKAVCRGRLELQITLSQLQLCDVQYDAVFWRNHTIK